MRLRTAAGLGLAIACSLIAAASASAATQLTSGRLTDAQGRGTVGEVRVYAWPHHTKAMDLPLLGVAHAAADGTFTVVAIDDRRLQRLAAQRDGFLDMTAVADTPGYQGERTWTSFVGPAGGRLHTVPAQSVRAGQARISSLASPAPRINIRAARRLPIRAHSSQQPHCQVKRQVQPTQSRRSSAIVGELNNAYNDGTVGTFLYGREHVAETDVGIVHTFTDVKGAPQVDISDQTTIKNGGVATFPPATRRYARKLKTEFEFTREAARNDTCAVWDVYIRATSWVGGTDSRTKQPGALDRCDPKAFSIGFEGTGGFLRYQNNAVRWTRGAQAFGFYTTTKSGFSTNVETKFTWGGPPSKRHYLCGPDGKQSPYESGRIFSGARKAR